MDVTWRTEDPDILEKGWRAGITGCCMQLLFVKKATEKTANTPENERVCCCMPQNGGVL